MEKVQILWVGRATSRTAGGVKPHSHPYYHLLLLISGNINITVNGVEYRLEADSCILIPKEAEHSYFNSGDSTAVYLEIKFTLPSTTLDLQITELGTLVSNSALTRMLAVQIVDDYADHGAQADEAAASYLMALLHTLIPDNELHPSQTQYIDSSQYNALSRQIIQYLEEHFAENVSLEQLAEALGKNKSYLCIAFKKNTQVTINDCLNMIRIRRAAELITYSDYSLAQVSDLCGFSSTSHFNRVFLKYVGITPGQCRKAYPDGILIQPFTDTTRMSDRFMYSVLAKKRIILDTTLSHPMPE